MSLIDDLINSGYLRNPLVIDAFRKIRRVDFLPNIFRQPINNLAELNEALPIGSGQTISQPSVVAFMIELLEPRPGDKVLDIGAGSGWTTALLAEIVGFGAKKGRVVAIEAIPELKEYGQRNVAKYDFTKSGIVRYELGDGGLGFPPEAPFDRILASAAGDHIPGSWGSQLKTGGIIVAPVKNSIWKIEKLPDGKYLETEYPGFVFVPLVTKKPR